MNQVFARKALFKASSSYVANNSIFIGIPFFLIATAITGDLFRLSRCPWQAYVFFALAGVSNFAIGRTWGLKSIQLIGVTRSGVITGMNFVVTILLAVIALGEGLKPLAIVGILLSLTGPLLLAFQKTDAKADAEAKANGRAVIDRGTLYKGSLYAVGAAVFWGLSPIFTKFGLDAGGAPVLGNLVSYMAATVVISPSMLFNAPIRNALFKTSKGALGLVALSSVCSSTGQLLRNLALAYGLVIVVSLTGRTQPLWGLVFAFLFIRQDESFSKRVLLSNALLILGSVLVLFG